MADPEGWGFRYFVLLPDDTLLRVSQRVAEGLRLGTDRLPQYAGQTLRALFVVLDTEHRRPVRIYRIEPLLWRFDQDGGLVRDLRHIAEILDGLGVPSSATAQGSVVDITGQLARRRHERERSWTPDPLVINRVVQAIWPEAAGRSVERLSSVPGIQKRRPPMTLGAKHAVRECASAVMTLSMRLDDLRPNDLKAFIAACEEQVRDTELTEVPIWRGIMASAERRPAVVQARRSPKGTWYAVAQRSEWEDDRRRIARVQVIEEQECNGRPDAIAACRELLRKHAGLFDRLVTVEVECYPAIERVPEPTPDTEPS